MEGTENNHDVQIAILNTRLANIEKTIEDIKKLLTDYSSKFVTQDQFWLVRTIVYSGSGTVLMAALGGVIALIWKS